MDDLNAMRTYVSEVRFQARCAVNAFQNIGRYLERSQKPMEGDAYEVVTAEIFRNVHSFLTHSSNVSLLFWPTPLGRPRRGEKIEEFESRRDQMEKRSKDLRSKFGMADDNPLKDRTLRNHLEHFDERLDEWVRTSKSGNSIDRAIGPAGAFGGSGVGKVDMHRQFDPGQGLFFFRNDRFALIVLAEAVDEVLQTAKKMKDQ